MPAEPFNVYRATLKQPTDSIRLLAIKYRSADDRDTVKNGIKRAQHLFGEVAMHRYTSE